MTKAEYEHLFMQRTVYSGRGLATSVATPCPFCCEPDFMKFRVIDTEEALRRGGTCKACKRSIVAVFTGLTTGQSFELVQTGGPDQEPNDWYPPMRRMPV